MTFNYDGVVPPVLWPSVGICILRFPELVSSEFSRAGILRVFWSWYPQSFPELVSSEFSRDGILRVFWSFKLRLTWSLANWEFVKPVLQKYFPIKHWVLRITQTWSVQGSSKHSIKLSSLMGLGIQALACLSLKLGFTWANLKDLNPCFMLNAVRTH